MPGDPKESREYARNRENLSRDEILSAYERGVWTLVAFVGVVVVGLIVWLGYLLV